MKKYPITEECPKCKTAVGPWRIFDYNHNTEFVNCKICNAWFEHIGDFLVATRKRPKGLK